MAIVRLDREVAARVGLKLMHIGACPTRVGRASTDVLFLRLDRPPV
jgi:hypothetical protein